MPYIKDADKFLIDDCVSDGSWPVAHNAGELNYIFTTIAQIYVNDIGERYQSYNDVIGALEACKLELYRRLVAPYEDKKIMENGDVY